MSSAGILAPWEGDSGPRFYVCWDLELSYLSKAEGHSTSAHSGTPNRNTLSTDLKMVEGIFLSPGGHVNGKRVTISVGSRFVPYAGEGSDFILPARCRPSRAVNWHETVWSWWQLTGSLQQMKENMQSKTPNNGIVFERRLNRGAWVAP